jgi:DNA replication licensing factor MCM6
LEDTDANYQAYADQAEEASGKIHYYKEVARNMKNEEKSTMLIDYEHLQSFKFREQMFTENIVGSYHRFEPYLRIALTQFMNELKHSFGKERFFQIGFYNMPAIRKIRDLKTSNLGQLMSIHGTVTRTTEVRPELLVGGFLCKECNHAVNGVEQQFKYTEPVRCSNDSCQNKQRWELVNQSSYFIDW